MRGILLLLLFPFCLMGYGEVLARNYQEARFRGRITWYLTGFFALLAGFTVFSIPFTILGRPFHELRNVFAVIYIAGVGIYFIFFSLDKRYLQLRQAAQGVLAAIRRNWWIAIPLAVIAWQILRSVVFMTRYYSDDKIYINRILDMICLDGILETDPATGVFSAAARMSSAKFVLSSWLQFLASCCSMTGIHPLILIKTIFPVFMISFHYLIIWKMTWYLSPEEKKRSLMLLFYTLLMEFGSISIRTDFSYYLFTWSWYGKTVYQFAIIPAVILFFLMIMQHTTGWRDGLLLMILCLAGIGTSTTALMLLPAQLIILIFFECISKRSVRELWISVPSFGPLGVCAMLFFVLF